MPVIRGEYPPTTLSSQQRQALIEQLGQELAGNPASGGPVIFEIPLEQNEKFDVLAIWQEFEGVRSEDRSELILAAYGKCQDDISQALGVTYREAVQQQLLPYAVQPLVRKGEIDETQLKEAMLREGGTVLPNGKVELRFPTMKLAEAAHRRLCDALPKGYWSIAETLGHEF